MDNELECSREYCFVDLRAGFFRDWFVWPCLMRYDFLLGQGRRGERKNLGFGSLLALGIHCSALWWAWGINSASDSKHTFSQPSKFLQPSYKYQTDFYQTSLKNSLPIYLLNPKARTKFNGRTRFRAAKFARTDLE